MRLMFLTETQRVLFSVCDKNSDDKTVIFSLLLNSAHTVSRTLLAVIRLRSTQKFGRRYSEDS